VRVLTRAFRIRHTRTGHGSSAFIAHLHRTSMAKRQRVHSWAWRADVAWLPTLPSAFPGRRGLGPGAPLLSLLLSGAPQPLALCDTQLSIQVHHSFKHAFCLDYTKSTSPKSLHGRRVCCSLIFIANVVTYVGMGMDLCKRSPIKLQNVVTRLASHQASTPCPDLHSKLANDPANTTVRLMYKERNVPYPTVRYHT
jgi:hypothetical protein